MSVAKSAELVTSRPSVVQVVAVTTSTSVAVVLVAKAAGKTMATSWVVSRLASLMSKAESPALCAAARAE